MRRLPSDCMLPSAPELAPGLPPAVLLEDLWHGGGVARAAQTASQCADDTAPEIVAHPVAFGSHLSSPEEEAELQPADFPAALPFTPRRRVHFQDSKMPRFQDFYDQNGAAYGDDAAATLGSEQQERQPWPPALPRVIVAGGDDADNAIKSSGGASGTDGCAPAVPGSGERPLPGVGGWGSRFGVDSSPTSPDYVPAPPSSRAPADGAAVAKQPSYLRAHLDAAARIAAERIAREQAAEVPPVVYR